jgi:hypothetical protein
MKVAAKKDQRINRQLVHVVRHPIRVQALTILTERVASPKEISDELLEPLGTVSHHVRELEKFDLVEEVDTAPRRGAVEHYFRAKRRPWLSSEEWDELGLEDRQQFSVWILQLSLTDAASALNAGTFDTRSDRHLSRVPLRLDVQGWREVTDIQNSALASIIVAQEAATARIEKSDGDEGVIYATASMSCFEGPPPRKEQRPE